MDELPDWVPENLDLSRPSPARVYDYFLGGAHNFAPDREMARQILQLHPSAETNAQANRAFLHRAVRRLIELGIRQFVDLGSGIPTVGNVHEIAHALAPQARVVYVDIDPIAVAHSQLILHGVQNATVIDADLRRPKEILARPELRELIDLSEPVAFLMVSVLHFIPESDHPQEAIADLYAAAAAGSYLVISHGHDARLDAAGAVGGSGTDPEQEEPGPQAPGTQVSGRRGPQGQGADQVESGDAGRPLSDRLAADGQKVLGVYRSAGPITVRTRARLEEFFADWPLVEPGLVWVPQWYPDWPDDVGVDPSSSYVLAGMGRRK